jgi:hypothetical protein
VCRVSLKRRGMTTCRYKSPHCTPTFNKYNATSWTIGVLGFNSQWGLGIFLFTTVSRMALGPNQPPIQWVPGALSLVVKQPGREADHSPLLSAEIMNVWSYTSTPRRSSQCLIYTVHMALCIPSLILITRNLPVYYLIRGWVLQASGEFRLG